MCGSSRRQRGHEARKVIVLGEDGTDAYLERGPEDAELDERHGVSDATTTLSWE